jgi:hypothetical protein
MELFVTSDLNLKPVTSLYIALRRKILFYKAVFVMQEKCMFIKILESTENKIKIIHRFTIQRLFKRTFRI